MRILKRSIALLLFICMMFSTMPLEFMQSAFAEPLGVDSGSLGSAGTSNSSGGVYAGNEVGFRIQLSRDSNNFLNGTQDQREKVLNYYSNKWPNGYDYGNNTIFFTSNKMSKWLQGISRPGNTAKSKNNVGTYTPGASVSKSDIYVNDKYSDLIIQGSTTTNVNLATANKFKNYALQLYDAGTVKDLGDFGNNIWLWGNGDKITGAGFPTGTEALDVLSTIFAKSGDSYKVVENITTFVEGNNKGLFIKEPSKMTEREKFEVSAGYAGLLIYFYSVIASSDSPNRAGTSATFETGINDYLMNANTEEKPVTLVIDTAIAMVDNPRFYYITPTIDMIQFMALTSETEVLTNEANQIVVENLNGINLDKKNDTKKLIKEMYQKAVNRVSFGEVYTGAEKGDTGKPIRFADYNIGNMKSLNTHAIPWAHDAFFFETARKSYKGVIENTKENKITTEGYATSHFPGYLSFLRLDNSRDIYGFVIIGNHIATPEPTVSYLVEDEIIVPPSGCAAEVQPSTLPTIMINIGGNSALISSMNHRKNDVNFQGIKMQATVKRTEYRNGFDEGCKFAVVEHVDYLEQQLNRSLLGDELLYILSGNPIILEDKSLLTDEGTVQTFMKSELGTTSIRYVYDINIDLYIDKAEYYFGTPGSDGKERTPIVYTSSDGTKYNFAEFVIPKLTDDIPPPPEIEIIKPSSVDTTEIVNPSENENLAENNQMIKRHQFTSGGAQFAEIKNNAPLQEQYEVMAGVPSTEELYYSVGGNEFQVALVIQHWMNEHSRDRTYTVHFDGNTCEFNNNEKGKGDTFANMNVPAPEGASSSELNVSCTDNELSASWTVTFTTKCKATSNGCHDVSIDCVGYDMTAFNKAKEQANAWITLLGNPETSTIEWTAASEALSSRESDKKGLRKGFATLDSTTGPDTWVAPSVTHQSGSCRGCTCSGDEPCGECHGIAKSPVLCKEQTITYTIKLTIPPHQVCGPCCGHVMPELWDTWRQGMVFDFAKIAQIRLYKLDQGSVDGLKELIGVETVFASVRSGNPTYFMNIAQMTEKKRYGQDIIPAHFDKTESTADNIEQKGLTASTLKDTFITYLGTGKTNDDTLEEKHFRTLAQSSRAGRLRYTLAEGQNTETITITEQGNGTGGTYTFDPNLISAPEQHDDVIYHAGARSKNCDGMATTNNFGKKSSDNVKPMEFTGHVNDWADGCLYTNIMEKTVQAGIPGCTTNTSAYSGYWDSKLYSATVDTQKFEENTLQTYTKNDIHYTKYKEDYNHHVVRPDVLSAVSTDMKKTAYNDAADERDTQTAEWQFFNKARRTKIVGHVISDFLILQTSGGDQSIFYYEKESEPTEAQEHFQKVIIEPEELFYNNPLSIFIGDTSCKEGEGAKQQYTKDFIIVGGYNGQYNEVDDKYRPYNMQDGEFKKFYDEGWDVYNATEHRDESGNYATKGYLGNTEIKTIFDDDPAKTIKRPERQAKNQNSSFKIYQDNLQILPTNPNKLYTPGESKVFYSQVLGYYSIDRDVIDAMDRSNIIGTIGNVSIGWPQQENHGEYYKKYWGSGNGVDYTTKYFMLPMKDRLSGDVFSTATDSGATTVNPVIVYTPVSTEDAIVMELDDFEFDVNGVKTKVSRDQRVNNFEYPNMNDLVNDLKVCPLDPELCEYRYLDCKFHEDTVLAEFDFEDTYVEKNIKRVKQADGSVKQKIVYGETLRNTYHNGTNWVTTDKVSGIEYMLPGGFNVGTYGKTGSTKELYANGTRWAIPLNSLGLSTNKSNMVEVEMDLTVDSTANNLMLASFYHYGFVLNPTNTLGSFIARSEEDSSKIGPRMDAKYSTSLNKVKVKIKFGFNNVVDCEASINGVPANLTVSDLKKVWNDDDNDGVRTLDLRQVEVQDWINDAPRTFTVEDIGTNLIIGSWGSNDNYKANYYIDNLKITLKGGTTEHNSTCYERLTVHQTKRIHVHDEDCYLKDDMYTCTGELNGNYQLRDDFQSAQGTKTWTAATDFTIPADGTYTIELYGEKGDDSSKAGGKGGHVKGTFTATKGQILNISIATGGGSSGEQGGNAPVVKLDGTLLAIAGGGGGGSGCSSGYAGYNAGQWQTHSSAAIDGSGYNGGSNSGCGAGGGAGYQPGQGSNDYGSHGKPAGGGTNYVGGLNSVSINKGSDSSNLGDSTKTTIEVILTYDIGPQGTPGLDYPNGDYTKPTVHIHNKIPQVLICGKVEGSGGTPIDFSYKNSVQQTTLQPGRYLLEVWGAQGGTYNNGSKNPGEGGYSKGILNLTNTDTLYIVTGGQGTTTTGGYNGGGDSSSGYGGGGGATHIGLKSGLLTTFSSDYSSQLLLVAGGGGGCEYSSDDGYGGAGGGENGQAGYQNSATNGAGGTQTSGASFGAGGSISGTHRAGGGGGFYGGYAGSSSNKNGGGGSGFVNKSLLTDTNTIVGNTSFLSPAGTSEIGHSGDGYARITPLNHTHTQDCYGIIMEDVGELKELTCNIPTSGGQEFTFSTVGETTKTLSPGVYKIEAWGAQGGSGNSSSGTGGKGAYVSGEIVFDKETPLYINVGGQPSSDEGGYNGGGVGCSDSGAGGGGATHVATASGLLSSLSSNTTSILLVAGGGGGAGCNDGSVGGAGPVTNYSSGTFGKGGDADTRTGSSYDHGGGGGAGYTGGGGNSACGGGGGGSNYISSVFSSTVNKNGDASFPNTAGTGNETGHSGDGFVKITLLGHTHTDACYKTITIDIPDGYYAVQKCGKSATGGTTIDTTYTYESATYKTVTLDAGLYEIELYGAEGGYCNKDTSVKGSKGTYVRGQLELSSNSTVYLYIGGQGVPGNSKAGGFNGGGTSGGCSCGSGSGGGATDIRIGGTAVGNRVMVAGGGGGAGTPSYPGYTTSKSNGTLLNGSAGNSSDGGGGGGGYHGGAGGVSSDLSKVDIGGYIGTSYVNNTEYTTDVSTDTYEVKHNVNSGNGKIVIKSLGHTHTEDCFDIVLKPKCDFLGKGELVCHGRLNATTDFNVHVHTADCLTTYAEIDTRMLRYTGDVQTFVVPYTDEYTFEAYGPEFEGRTAYSRATLSLRSGQVLYIYVGGTAGYNDYSTDIRVTPPPSGTAVPGEEAIWRDQWNQSLGTRVISAGNKEGSANTFVREYQNCTPINGYTGMTGGAGNGRVIITCKNTQLNPTIYQQIINGDMSHEDVKKYLGEPLYNKIMDGKEGLLHTWENWTVNNTLGFEEMNNVKLLYGGSSLICGKTENDPGTPIELDYTGRVEEVNLPAGEYKLEVWGAQGGGHFYTSNQNISYGGYGGYSSGTISLSTPTTLYVVVGGAGGYTNLGTYTSYHNGYNGGGNVTLTPNGNDGGAGGGGATHIATRTGLLSSLNSYRSDVLIVAGGGGGTEHVGTGTSTPVLGGSGGGLSGGIAVQEVGNSNAATQTSGYAFGQGQSVSGTHMGSGGGGWFGGYAGTSQNTVGNGGSGYIGGVQNGTTENGKNGNDNIIGLDGRAVITPLKHTHTNECYGGGVGGYNCGLDENSEEIVGEFSYKGSEENITLPAGRYKLEVWGAQGGTTYDNYAGGKGAYVSGELNLNSSTNLYIHVGGQGGNYVGGYNGGGTSGSRTDGGGGGGATDIRLVSGTWDNSNGLLSRIIVGAGGAAGCWQDSTNIQTMAAGGTESSFGNYPATQSSAGSGGSFGKGVNSLTASGYPVGAGGGGWYGGGGLTGGVSQYATSSGGSSYAVSTNSYKPTGYSVTSQYYLTNITMISGKDSMTSPTGVSETGHSGNGYARITRLSHTHTEDCGYSSGGVGGGTATTLTCDIPVGGDGQVRTYGTVGETNVTLSAGRYRIEAWGAQGGSASYGVSVDGGKGGYSVGELTLTSSDILYINIGGKGSNGNTSNTAMVSSGGYNGGGSGATCVSGGHGAGGGGATHVALSSGLLSTFSSNYTSQVLLVAGGGGGGDSGNNYGKGTGGYGGGTSGGNGGGYNSNSNGKGASQTAAGALGTGNNTGTAGGFGYGSDAQSSGSGGGGGGAGLYGGGSGNYVGSSYTGNGGGGGSGYVNTSKLTSAQTIGGNTSFPNTAGTGNETGHSGNGFVKITSLDHQHTADCYTTVPIPDGYMLNCDITQGHVHSMGNGCFVECVSEEGLTVISSGNPAQFEVPLGNIPVEAITKIVVYSKNCPNSVGKIYLKDETGTYNSNDSVTSDRIEPNTENQVMTFVLGNNPNLSGELTYLMFELANVSSRFNISKIEVYGYGYKVEGTGDGTDGAEAGTVYTFDYKNSVQTKELSPGRYKLEVWGAQGGSGFNSSAGGKGGYSVGELVLNEKKTVYIVTGGKGIPASGTSWTQTPVGGYNGGGNGNGNSGAWGGAGGGATHIGYKSSVLTGYSSDYSSKLLLVAGGGGGGGHGTAGGAGGGTSGIAGTSGAAVGTQTSGNAFGQGGSSTGHDMGAGGGGFYGAKASTTSDASAGGGSGYVNSNLLESGTYNTIAGNASFPNTAGTGNETGHSGDGYAKITVIKSFTELEIVYEDPLDGCKTIIDANINLIPDKINGDYNPIWLCKFKEYNTHSCEMEDRNGEIIKLCKTHVLFNCTEPHHRGEHYSGSNRICWSACGDDTKHANTKKEVQINGETERLAQFVQLDAGFTVYFPNIGNFEGNNAHGLAATQITRGMGYTDNMDTTQWTREKRVKFPFEVIFDDKENGEMLIHERNTWIELDVETEFFNFYVLSSNPEMSNVRVQFEVEAINCGTSSGIKVKRDTSADRNKNNPYLMYYNSSSTTNVDNTVDKIYAEKITDFQTEYINVLFNAVKSGYQVSYPNVGFGNSSASGAFTEHGFMRFYESKKAGIETDLRTAMQTTDTRIEEDFEGTTRKYTDKIWPHTKSGNGINHNLKDITSNDNKKRVDNRMRSNSLESLHGGYKSFYLDVIGRIGNFAVTDTDDYRFSNFFKMPVSKMGALNMQDANNWLVEGVVEKVHDDIQNFYIGDTYDIRGNSASVETRWLDTYHTQSWMTGTYDPNTGERDINNPNLKSQILTGEANNIAVLKDEELRFGYDTYTSINTVGSYVSGNLQVIPKYYALKLTDNVGNDSYDKAKGTFVALDVYISKDGLYTPVNIFGNAANGKPNIQGLKLNDFAYNLDWTTESGRRNYTLEEKQRTQKLQDLLTIYDYGDVDLTGLEPDEIQEVLAQIEPEVNKLKIPNGKNNYMGSAQYMLLDGKHRTFIGTSESWGGNIYDSEAGTTDWGTDKNIGKVINDVYFEKAVQRWHGKLGVPSSSVFVPSGMDVNTNTIKYVMNEEWAIVCTAEIIAIGDVWSISYSQPWFKTMEINNNTYSTSQHYPGHRIYQGDDSVPCPNCIPPIIAVYSSESSSVDDVEIVQTH